MFCLMEKSLKHTLHLKGRSPVWTRIWSLRLYIVTHVQLYNIQMSYIQNCKYSSTLSTKQVPISIEQIGKRIDKSYSILNQLKVPLIIIRYIE